jgi:hypothetical protein
MLPEPAIVEILKHFSAKDLASAWIGPQEVLNRLAACVPQRKLELMRTYSSSVAASRASSAFVRLHQLSVKGLQDYEAARKNETLAA